jgi:ankyrin repeat protein
MSRLLHLAIRQGHRALAERLANDKAIGHNLNDLHRQVLCGTRAPLRAKVLAASVRKKSFMDQDLTPVHYACINNDTQYLEVKMLWTVVSDMFVFIAGPVSS